MCNFHLIGAFPNKLGVLNAGYSDDIASSLIIELEILPLFLFQIMAYKEESSQLVEGFDIVLKVYWECF
jgi:hypothetical protein